jgi:small subunit ribosomal protein S16
MATKIRLARHGKKDHAFFHIVVADSRSPRDGRFIEKLGTYNPHTNPATIELNFDSALSWMMKGAQPTDTARAILSYKGVMYKKHLLGGVAKGAFTEAEADSRFEKWLQEKAGKIEGKTNRLSAEKEADKKARLANEAKAKEAKAAAVAAKNAPAPAEEEVAEVVVMAETETPEEAAMVDAVAEKVAEVVAEVAAEQAAAAEEAPAAEEAAAAE